MLKRRRALIYTARVTGAGEFFFLGLVEQLYCMRDRAIPAAVRKLNRMRDCVALMIFKKSRDRFTAFSQRSAACSS